MKFLGYILLFFAPLFAMAQTQVDTLLQLLRDSRSDYVFVIAHRADWRSAPENSVAAIKSAIEIGADMVEIDIQKTKDGNFVLMHDGSIDRMTDKKGNVNQFTVEELKTFFLKNADGSMSKEPICTLEEALLACKDKVLVNIDKGDAYIKEIIPIIRKTGTEKQVVIKGRHSAEKVNELFEGHETMLYMPVFDLDREGATKEIATFLDKRHPLAVEVIFNKDDFPALNYISEITKSGSRVWINTLWDSLCGGHTDDKSMTNPDENWGWVLEKGANMIQTDRPRELIIYLEKKKLRQR